MRLFEALGGGVVVAIVLVVLAHHLRLHVDLLILAGTAFLAAFVTVLIQPRDRMRR
jgi:hypothetical protein